MITTYPNVLQEVDSLTGIPNKLQSHHSFPIAIDKRTAIGVGAIPTHVPFRGLGRRDSLSTSALGDDIWEGVATSMVFPNQSTGEQCTLVSTSANDTSAGSGSQQVDVHYINAAGTYLVETVTMNGLTPVNTVATNIRFIQYIHTQRVSSLGATAAGDITIYSTATPANIFNVIKAGGNMSLSSARMVPAGLNFYVSYLMTSATSNKPVSVRFRATCDFEGVLTPNIFLYDEIFEMQDSIIYMNLDVPRKIPSLSIIKATAYSSTAGGSVSLSYGGWME